VEHKELAQTILEEMFVRVKGAFSANPSDSDGAKATYLATKRISHPDYFPKYFLFRVPTGEIPDSTVENSLKEWNGLPDGSAVSTICGTLRQFKTEGQLIKFLRKLETFERILDETRVPVVVRAVYGISPELSREYAGLNSSEYDRAIWFILRLIDERLVEHAKLQTMLEEIVEQCQETLFFVSIVDRCRRAMRVNLFNIGQVANITRLRELGIARLQSRFLQDKKDIFEELPKDWPSVLHAWCTTWDSETENHQPEVQSYSVGMLDEHPNYLGIWLQSFMTSNGGLGGPKFYYEEFCKIFDPKLIVELLEKQLSQALQNDKQKEAAGLFMQIYRDKQKGANDSKIE